MKYHKIKKQTQKKSSIVPSDLVMANRFEEITALLRDKTELTPHDRYLYGYALLRTQQPLNALLALWPLTTKGNTALYQDCVAIATHIFQDPALLTMELSTEALYILVQIAKTLWPQSQICQLLKNRLYTTTWQHRDYEKLEKLLKSSKDQPINLLIENLSKLTFHQAERKLTGNSLAFISHILTGAACLIARNPMYHNHMVEAIHLLHDELQQRYLTAQQNQKLTINQGMFLSFLNLEANILAVVLPLAIKNGKSLFDVIPTPGYLIHFELSNQHVNEKFLPWLASENKDLFDLYDANMHQVILFILGVKNLSTIQHLLNSEQKNKLHPYLRLALMFRTATSKKPLLNLTCINDFDALDPNIYLKNLLIHTIKSVLQESSDSSINTNYYQLLREFAPIIDDAEIKKILTSSFFDTVNKQYREEGQLNFDEIREIAALLHSDTLNKQIDLLELRQQDCLKFLSTIKIKGKSKKYLNALKDVSALRDHLTLIADSCFLTILSISIDFLKHIEKLVTHKKTNAIIPLQDLFEYDFECYCSSCVTSLFREEIPSVASKLNLPVMRLADLHSVTASEQSDQIKQSVTSILSQADPFQVLNIAVTDNKQIIMQKVMQLISQSPEKMTIFRQAQSELFNPAHRFLHHYLRYFAYESGDVLQKINPAPSANLSLDNIPFRRELSHVN